MLSKVVLFARLYPSLFVLYTRKGKAIVLPSC